MIRMIMLSDYYHCADDGVNSLISEQQRWKLIDREDNILGVSRASHDNFFATLGNDYFLMVNWRWLWRGKCAVFDLIQISISRSMQEAFVSESLFVWWWWGDYWQIVSIIVVTKMEQERTTFNKEETWAGCFFMHHMQLGFLMYNLINRWGLRAIPRSEKKPQLSVTSSYTAIPCDQIQMDKSVSWENHNKPWLLFIPSTSLNARILVCIAGQGKTENPCFLSCQHSAGVLTSKAQGCYLFRPMIWTMFRKRSSSSSKACGRKLFALA